MSEEYKFECLKLAIASSPRSFPEDASEVISVAKAYYEFIFPPAPVLTIVPKETQE